MNRLQRFPDSVKRDPDIEAWFNDPSDELGITAKNCFEVMRDCGDDVRELLHDGHPTACIADAAFACVNAFKAHVNVGFFRGDELPDPNGLLEGSGKFMHHLKLRPEGNEAHKNMVAVGVGEENRNNWSKNDIESFLSKCADLYNSKNKGGPKQSCAWLDEMTDQLRVSAVSLNHGNYLLGLKRKYAVLKNYLTAWFRGKSGIYDAGVSNVRVKKHLTM